MVRCLILIAALVAVAYAGKGKCPKVLGKFPFEEAKFDGEWFTVAGMPIMDEKFEETKCGKFNFHFTKSDTSDMTVTYKAYNQANELFTYESILQSFKSEKASMAFSVWKKEGNFPYSSVYKQNIIATDYENYAVILACRPEFDSATKTFGRHFFAHILSRKQTLPKETLNTLINIVSGYDIDTKYIKVVDRSKCATFH